MAKLDAAIDKLLQSRDSELLLSTGTGIALRTTAGKSDLVRQPLSTQQIIGALAEILPSDLRSDFPQPGSTHFPYKAPAGAVMVTLNFDKAKAKADAIIAPYGPATPEKPPAQAAAPSSVVAELPEEPEEESFELVAPSEMMNMAAALHSGAQPEPAKTPAKTKVAQAPASANALAGAALARQEHAAGSAGAQLEQMLSLMLNKGASDLHLSSHNPPSLRVDGDIVPLTDRPPLVPEQLKAMLWAIAPEKNKAQWEESRDTDFAYETGEARFRINVFMDRKGIGAVLRQIPSKIRSAEEMGLSRQVLDLCFLTKGLVLVTGPTGSGKSTTLAAMVDYVNRHREDHIITIEDPIEFVHPNKKCLVNQREVGTHTGSFKQALRAALREDPDVVLVGEMRDLETVAIAIETAETGHLVFGTLHTNTAPSTVDRIIDQFPADRQDQIRLMLSESLKAVISQTLCKKIGGGRAPAREVLLASGSVSNLIREGKTFQIPSIMQTGKNQGMVTMNDALFDLVRTKQVAPEDAYAKAVGKAEFKAMLERAGFKLDLERL